MPIGADLVRPGEFGPFDIVSDWAHAQYIDGYCEGAIQACRAALLVVEPAGDVQTGRYLRYIEAVALQEMGRHREAVTAALDLVATVEQGDDPCWRAKALALLAEASVGVGELKRALDALAEGAWLVRHAEPGSYGHVSASMAVALALRAMYLFEQAEELLEVPGRAGDPAVDIHILQESAFLQAFWAAALDFSGHRAEAAQHLVTCAQRAVRMRRTAQVLGNAEMAARAEVLEAFALSRLGSNQLAAAIVLSARDRFGQRSELLETQIVGLVLGQAMAERGRFAGARQFLDTALVDACQARRDVWAGVLLEAIAEVDVAEHGRHPAVGIWKRLGREALQRMWREREGRFAGLQDRLRMRELSEQAERMGHDVLVDPLTSLGNRRMLSQGVERAGSRLSVVFLDVDRFKQINDTFSHDVGDEVLLRLAAILRQQCRSDDVVVRYGGDEFVVLVSDGDGVEASERAGVVGERLLEAVRSACWDDVAEGLSVTVSVGVASVVPADSAIARADAALYAAKRAGRNRLVVAPGG